MRTYLRPISWMAAATLAIGTLLPVAAYASPDPAIQIVGGNYVAKDFGGAAVLYNYTAAGMLAQSVVCSGTVVHPQWIMTAAHCIEDDKATQLWRFSVRVNSLTSLWGGQNIAVDGMASENDVLLYHLTEPIKNPKIVTLANADPADKAAVQIAGWGSDDKSNFASAHLKIATANVAGFGKDYKSGPSITSIGSDGAAWHGDSGGPMFYKGEQVGVASTADLSMRYQNYASVAHHREFIKKTINSAPAAFTNQAPMMRKPPNQKAEVNKPFSYQVQAPDYEGGPVTFTAMGLPQGLSINQSSGLISGVPSTVGTAEVEIIAQDAQQVNISTKIKIVVMAKDPTNHAPTINKMSEQRLAVGASASVQFTGNDPDGDALGFYAYDLPPGLELASDGKLTGSTTENGTWDTRVFCGDTFGLGDATIVRFVIGNGSPKPPENGDNPTPPESSQPITTAPTKPTPAPTSTKPSTSNPASTKPTSPAPKPELPALDKNVPIKVSGAARSESFYAINVPAGVSSVKVTAKGGTGVLALSARKGDKPTASVADCRSLHFGRTDSVCTIKNAAGQTVYVQLLGYSAYSDVSLIATW